MKRPPSPHLPEVARLFTRLGITAFGGPAAHIALMHEETVKRRKWLTDRDFLDLIGITNLIPGPNSTEMAMSLGYRRAGWPGLFVAGTCFILPAFAIVLALAWSYTRYGTTPVAINVFTGVKPVIIAVILQALWILGRKAIRGPEGIAIGLASLVAYLYGVNEIAVLLFGASASLIWAAAKHSIGPIAPVLVLPLLATPTVGLAIQPYGVTTLFWAFLKIGSVLYGSGYVLLAFLHSEFVLRLGWLTEQQLIDAIAIGQVTPGPVFTAATFIGYILGGVTGSLAASVAIFLPSFFFVALTSPLLPRLRNLTWAHPLLDGLNVASLSLMAVVTWRLGEASLSNGCAIGVTLVALVLLIRFNVNTTWLIVGGAALGLLQGGVL